MKLSMKPGLVGALALATLVAACDRDGSEESPAQGNPPTSTTGTTTSPPVVTGKQLPTEPDAPATGTASDSSPNKGGMSTEPASASSSAAGGAAGSGAMPGPSSAQDAPNAGAASAGTAGAGAGAVGSSAAGSGAMLGSGAASDQAAAAAAAQGAVAAAQGAAATNGPAASAKDGNAGSMSPEGREFLFQAASGGLFEVEAARLAGEKATDPEIKAFASMLLIDHSKANAELNVLASMGGVILPNEMAANKRSELDRLAGFSGAGFDREYVQAVGIAAHKQDIELFESARGKVSNPGLKEWIEKTLPALRQHLEQAQKLAGA